MSAGSCQNCADMADMLEGLSVIVGSAGGFPYAGALTNAVIRQVAIDGSGSWRSIMKSKNGNGPIPDLKVPAGTDSLLCDRAWFRKVMDALPVHENDWIGCGPDRLERDSSIVFRQSGDQRF